MALGLVCTGTAAASETGQSTLDIADVGTKFTQGATNSSNLGAIGLADVGDINGDGVDDVAASSVGSGPTAVDVRGVNVIYTPTDDDAAIDLLDLKPDQGYRIRTATSTAVSVTDAGDQNGDGVSDFLLGAGTNLAVIYGVAPEDVSDLPLCGGTNVDTRCLDIPAFTADPFNPATGGIVLAGLKTSSGYAAGDFDGDGKNEIVVGGVDACTCGYLLPNASELTVPGNGVLTMPTDLPSGGLTLHGVNSGPLLTLLGRYQFAGDVNGDGNDDLAYAASTFGDEDGKAHVQVLFGSDRTGDFNVWEMGDGDGLQYDIGSAGEHVLSGGGPFGLDGLGHDGRPGLAVPSFGAIEAPFGFISTLRPPADEDAFGPFSMWPAVEDGGYLTNIGAGTPYGSPTNFPSAGASLSDVDGNGIDELAIRNGTAAVNGNANAGFVTTFFSKTSIPGNEQTWDSDLPGSAAMTVTGAAGLKVGTQVTDIGDVDGDGLGDMIVSGQPSSGSTLGALWLVKSSKFMSGARTGGATVVDDKNASVVGIVGANGRDVTAHFEYGTDDSYGSSTADESFDSSSGSSLLEAGLTGLDPETTYHYRTVVVNDLGLTRYGTDRTFTTTATPKDGCGADDTLPGCAGFCGAHPNSPACPGYQYCADAAHAGEAVCKAPAGRLSGLIVNTSSLKVKRGKKAVVRATIVNTGNASASGVKICASGPKALVRVTRCANLGALASGAAKTARIKIAVKPRAKRGKKAVIRLKATGQSLGGRSARVNLRVR